VKQDVKKKSKSKGKGKGPRKGSSFERIICGTLSKWWSGGLRDDLLWRSSGSGARARVRGRKGKATTGHHGDITATDKEAVALTKFVTIELKRGYSSKTPFDILDKPRPKQTLYEEWFEKQEEAKQQSGSFSWILIVKRDHRQAVVFIPEELSAELIGRGATFPFDGNASLTVRLGKDQWVDGFLLKDFLDGTSPDIMRKWYEEQGEVRVEVQEGSDLAE